MEDQREQAREECRIECAHHDAEAVRLQSEIATMQELIHDGIIKRLGGEDAVGRADRRIKVMQWEIDNTEVRKDECRARCAKRIERIAKEEAVDAESDLGDAQKKILKGLL